MAHLTDGTYDSMEAHAELMAMIRVILEYCAEGRNPQAVFERAVRLVEEDMTLGQEAWFGYYQLIPVAASVRVGAHDVMPSALSYAAGISDRQEGLRLAADFVSELCPGGRHKVQLIRNEAAMMALRAFYAANDSFERSVATHNLAIPLQELGFRDAVVFFLQYSTAFAEEVPDFGKRVMALLMIATSAKNYGMDEWRNIAGHASSLITRIEDNTEHANALGQLNSLIRLSPGELRSGSGTPVVPSRVI